MATRGSNELSNVVAATQGVAGGVNIRDAVNQLPANEVPLAENGVLDQAGVFAKRQGCLSLGTFGAGADRILSCYTYYRANLAPQVLIHTTAGALLYTADPTANPQVWTVIVSGLSATAPMSFETFNSKVYMSNGVDDYSSWDGTTRVTFSTAPKGKFLRLWKDTMWVAGVTGLQDRVYSSDPGNAESFGVASWVDIAKGDGDKITALGSDGTYLIPFKQNRHMEIYDPALFSNRVVDQEKGCESHFSVVQAAGNLYFLSRLGICQYLGDSPSRIISLKIEPIFDPRVINLAALDRVYAYTIGNQVGWSIPEVGSTVPTLQIEYYPMLGPLTTFGNRLLGPFAFQRMPLGPLVRYRSGNIDYLFGGSTVSNKLLRAFAPVGTDDGVAFAAILETGSFDFGVPTQTKYLRRVRTLGRGRTTLQIKPNHQTAVVKSFDLDMTQEVDTWSLADKWGDGTWGPSSEIREIPVRSDTYARNFQLRFVDASSDVGQRSLAVGSHDYALDAGGWAVFLVVMEATILGVRD